MDTGQLKHIVEAALLAYGQPLSVDQLREMFDEYERPDVADVRRALAELAQDCEGRPVELVEVASGWRLQVRSAFASRLSRLWQERPGRYSRALLETLALIAYRQPITRGEIEEIRGVSLSPNIIKTLIERGWVREVGVKEVPGRPALLGTTPQFLDDFNLKSLDELPALPEIKDPAQLEAALLRLGAAAPAEPAAAEAKPDETDEQPATVH